MIDSEDALRGLVERWAFWSRPWCAAARDGECHAADCASKNDGSTCPRPWLADVADAPDPLTTSEREVLLGWFREQLQRERDAGASTWSRMVVEIFDVLRWEADGSMADWWGGYLNGIDLVRSICTEAGWPS